MAMQNSTDTCTPKQEQPIFLYWFAVPIYQDDHYYTELIAANDEEAKRKLNQIGINNAVFTKRLLISKDHNDNSIQQHRQQYTLTLLKLFLSYAIPCEVINILHCLNQQISLIIKNRNPDNLKQTRVQAFKAYLTSMEA